MSIRAIKFVKSGKMKPVLPYSSTKHTTLTRILLIIKLFFSTSACYCTFVTCELVLLDSCIHPIAILENTFSFFNIVYKKLLEKGVARFDNTPTISNFL